MELVHANYREVVCIQRMETVVDRDFGGTVLMGTMSISCLRLQKVNADWITTKCATGKAGIGTLHWPC